MVEFCGKVFIITQDRRRLRSSRWIGRVFEPGRKGYRRPEFTGYTADEVVLKVMGRWHDNTVEGVARNLLVDVLGNWERSFGNRMRGRYYRSERWLEGRMYGRKGRPRRDAEDDGDGREQEGLS
jgi:hypothetical protein